MAMLELLGMERIELKITTRYAIIINVKSSLMHRHVNLYVGITNHLMNSQPMLEITTINIAKRATCQMVAESNTTLWLWHDPYLA